jgi:four helix bundle protein
MNTTSRADQLERRLIRFAASIVSLTSKLPRTVQGRHISSQTLRSGTAAAANYGEARGAESRADFIHKLKIVFKELNETTIWLEIIAESALLPATTIAGITSENRELCPDYWGFNQDSPGQVRLMLPMGQWVVWSSPSDIRQQPSHI